MENSLFMKNGIQEDKKVIKDSKFLLSKEYKKEVGINRLKKLSFDPEMSHCWISTKDLKEAENFLWWIYLKYIKPTLNTVLKSYI
jgi:hypothetical protein